MLRERRRHANFKPNRKLDRKSSRGMIYENEELRLRTININAEVERGQSDIKKLRRENYQLRKEIWTLRDEYDRLGKLLKNKRSAIDNSISDSHDCGGVASDCKHGCEYDEVCRCCSCLLDGDSVSCDTCNENEHCNDNFDGRISDKSLNCNKTNSTHDGYVAGSSNKSNQATMPKPVRNEKIDMNFDHLSVVSEECLSNSDDQANNKRDSDASTLKDPIYTNFQSTIPPLKHFENLSYKDIGPNIDSSGEIQFNGEMYQASEPTPPPPTPPPLPTANRKSGSLPLPPPPILTEDGDIVQDGPIENDALIADKSPPIYFFAPLKSKRKTSMDAKGELRPDVFVNNIVPSEGNRLATIRKPHNPLKCPSNSNDENDDIDTKHLDAIMKDIQGLSKGIETIQMQKNPTYENVKNGKSIKNADTDQPHPYRTEMSLVLSYTGNKSKYSTNQSADKLRESNVDISPTNLPEAMKLLPNKLNYVDKSEKFKQITQPTYADIEQVNINTENSANEEVFTKSQDNTSVERSDKKNVDVPKKTENGDGKNGENRELRTNGEAISSTINRENDVDSQLKSKDSSTDQQESKHTDETSKSNNSPENTKDPKARRVSIHFNGKPMTQQQETELHSNESSVYNTTDLVTDELLCLTPMSCRRSSRRSSKIHDDSIGSFLYPPNPFGFGGMYSKKSGGRRSSFLSRRHSDSLLPAHYNQYNVDYALPLKNGNHHHCHRGHPRNHQSNTNHCDACNNMGSGVNIGESTGTSMCNSIASSRESLASISQQSTSRRKISITSHSKNGGKIPWCACWGNGCV